MPAALLPPDSVLSAGQSAALEKIADDFNAEVNKALSNPNASDAQVAEVWDTATQTADDRYRLLYGDAAYMDKTMAAQLEAMGKIPSSTP